MEKCDCECHKLHPIPCMFRGPRHVEPPPEPEKEEKTDPTASPEWPPLDEEGFPF